MFRPSGPDHVLQRVSLWMEHCLGSKFGPKLCARNLGQTGIRPVCSRNASATETSAQVYNNDENNADFRTLISMKIIIGVFLIYGSDIY